MAVQEDGLKRRREERIAKGVRDFFRRKEPQQESKSQEQSESFSFSEIPWQEFAESTGASDTETIGDVFIIRYRHLHAFIYVSNGSAFLGEAGREDAPFIIEKAARATIGKTSEGEDYGLLVSPFVEDYFFTEQGIEKAIFCPAVRISSTKGVEHIRQRI